MNEPILIATAVIAVIIFVLAFTVTFVIKPLRKAGCLGSIFFSLFVMLFALGASWLLFNTLTPANGQVINRSEQVLTSTRGDWSRSTRVTVAYGGDGEAERSVELLVDWQSYDYLLEGTTTQLRVLSLGSFLSFARLVDMSPLSLVKLALADLRLSLPDALVGERLVAQAVIRKITTVKLDYYFDDDNQEQVRELSQPFDLVVFEFVPAGRDEAVVTVDKVDSNSLDVGVNGRIQVQYLPDNPRAAAINDASHTYRWRNPLSQVLPALLVIALIAFAAIIWRVYATAIKGKSEPDGGQTS